MKNTSEIEKWDLVIEPKNHLLDIKFKQLLGYFDLLLLFVKKEVTVNYKQTILGPLWFFIQPILTTIIYQFIFGNVAKISTDGLPQPLFYMSGIIIWNYFSDCFINTSDTFVQNSGIFGKVYFPRLISPLSVIISNALKFLIQFVLFLGLYFYFYIKGAEIHIQINIIIIPLLLILMAMLGLGFGIIFSSMTTKYRDLKFLIQFGVQLLMYATPIIYPLSTISEKYLLFFKLNPITHIIEAFKYSFFGVGYFSYLGLLYSTILIFLILVIGILIFNKTEKDFMDTV